MSFFRRNKMPKEGYNGTNAGILKDKVGFFILSMSAIAFVFLIVLVFGFNITGNAIKNLDLGKTILVNIEMEVNSGFFTSGKIGNIIIASDGLEDIYIEGRKFNLPEKKNLILIENFNGEVEILDNNINLNGNALGISVNGVYTEAGDSEVEIYFGEDFGYKKIELKDVFVNKRSYQTSGKLKTGNDILLIDNEVLELGNFYGDVTIKNRKIEFVGEVEFVKIIGEVERSFNFA